MPYALGLKSFSALQGVHPDLVSVVKRAIELTDQDFTVQEGLRALETQKEYFRRGVTKTMNSKHLKQADGYGHAVDLVPWINGQPRWEWPLIYPIAAAMRQAARELGVRVIFGGVWDKALNDIPLGNGMTAPASIKREVEAYAARHPGPDFLDGPHYQLA